MQEATVRKLLEILPPGRARNKYLRVAAISPDPLPEEHGHKTTADTPPPAPRETLPTLEAEEALYRLWWRTLPSKELARQWRGHLGYWQVQRGLSTEAMTWLRDRIQDLLSPPRAPEEP